MPNVTLTPNQIKLLIFSSCYYYSSFGKPADIETAHDIAVEAGKVDFFEGVALSLGITYPLPVEPQPLPVV